MKTSSAKQKGRKLQQWVRGELLRIFPSLTTDDVRSTSMGAGGEDVLLSQAARHHIRWSIECKSRHAIAVYPWLEQRSHEKYPSIVFAKGNHKEPIVVMYAVDFFNLIREEPNAVEATCNE